MKHKKWRSFLAGFLSVLIMFTNVSPILAYATDDAIQPQDTEIVDPLNEDKGGVSEEELSNENFEAQVEEEEVETPAETTEEIEKPAEAIEPVADVDPVVAGSFYLSAVSRNEVIIEPVTITYTTNQTVREALEDSPYSFGGIEQGFITNIEGVSGSYTIYMDDEGYALDRPASEVDVVAIYEGEFYSNEIIALITRLGEVNEMDNNTKNYGPVREAYNNAVSGLRSADAAKAAGLLAELNDAIEEYNTYLETGRVSVDVIANQNGTSLSNPVITMTDVYGNETSVTGTSIELIPGDYVFTVSDGGYNRTEGNITVEEGAELTVELPAGEWFDNIRLLNSNRDPFEYELNKETHTAQYFVDDNIGSSGVRINASPGEDIPMAGSSPAAELYANYIGLNNGNDWGSEESSSNKRTWNSTASTLTGVVLEGMDGREFAIEARHTNSDGHRMIQSYDVEITRVPTITNIIAKDGNGTSLLTGFDSATKEYSFETINEILDVEAVPYGEDYTISVDAPIMDDEQANRVLIQGTEVNVVTVTVSHENGQNNTYTLNVNRVSPAVVNLETEAGVTVEVQNANGDVIAPREGTEYELVPGETYTYVATIEENYHTTATFTAEEGQTITIATPVVEEAVSDISLFDAIGSNREEYMPNSEFSIENYDYEYVVSDAIGSLYGQATPQNDYRITARYYQQYIGAQAYNGEFNEVNITNTVGSSRATNLVRTLARTANDQELIIRGSKEIDGVTYYQDYTLNIIRSLHLDSFVVEANDEVLTLLDENGDLESFDRDVQDYYVDLPFATSSIDIAATFMNEDDSHVLGGGYYAMINGERYDDISDLSFELDSGEVTEEIEIEVYHENTNTVSNSYTLHINKVDPVTITFETEPENAIVFLQNEVDGKIPQGENNAFTITPGQKYTYNVTLNGYVGQQVTGYVVPEEDATVKVTLEAAEPNENLQELEAEWPSFRGDSNNNGVVDKATPIKAEDAVLYWGSQLGSGWGAGATGVPILVDGYLYTYAMNSIIKVDTITGEVVAEGDMIRGSNFGINSPTYAKGMIFVGLSNGGIQAFDANTLESLWIYNDPLGGQPNTELAYHDGYIYTGFWGSETRPANFVAVSVTDEDPSRPDEEKIASWTHTQPGGFYWAGAYVSDDFLLVGTDDGESGYSTGYANLLSIHPKTGEIIDQIQMPHVGDIRSNVTYDEHGTGDYYFTTKGGYFYGISVNNDGTFTENSLKYIKLENGTSVPSMSTSTPAVYNGRAYVGVSGAGQFSAYSGHNITVLDLVNWEVAYIAPTQGYPQTSGILTNAYEEETGKVYVYFIDNYTPGKLRMLSDQPGQTELAEVTEETYTSGGNTHTIEAGYVLFTPTGAQAQYAISTPVIDQYGNMYFKNDSAHVMKVGNTIESMEVTRMPNTIYAVGDTFNYEGMEVTLRYSNGLSQVFSGDEIERYLTFSNDALTLEDTDFQIRFEHVMYQNKDGEAGVAYTAPMAVINLTILETADEIIEAVENKIAAIGEVTLESEGAIQEARAAFDALSEEQQNMVENASDLEAAETRFTELKAAEVLGEVKAQAKAELSLYKDSANYREAEQVELATAIEAGKDVIDAATDVEEVRQALDNAKSVIDNIKTDAELTAEEEQALADAKEAAKSALDNYKDADAYREAEQAELAAAIQAGKDAIDAVETVADVEAALEAAQDDIDTIKTAAELTAEEDAQALADAKEAAKSALDSYKDADAYREAEQAELAAAIQAGKDAIDAAETVAEVEAALEAAQDDIDTIKTDAELTAEEDAQALADAKEAAKSALDGYKDADAYREAEQAELAAAIQAGKDAIDAAADIDAVATALDNAKLVINDIKTDAELAAEEAQALAEAQEAAKAELDNYKDSADYREAEQAELAAAIQAGKDAIGAAADIDAVATALDNAKFAINNIKTDAELTAEELVIGKETAKAELDNYKDADIYREAQRAELASAIEVGKNAIDAAITIADVEVALEVAKADLDTIKTDAELTEEEELLALNEAKESAKLELEGFKNLEDYREAQKAELLNAVEFGKESIDLATDKNGVAVALSEAKDIIRTIKTDAELTAEEVAQALKEAQEAAKAELDNYKDFAAYREAEQNELARIVQAGKEAIDLATTIEAVDIAVNNAKLTMDTINTDAQLTAEEDAQALADAKEAAKSALDGYKDSADYRESEQAELATAIQVGKDVIDAATDIDAVAIALDNAKFAINNIKTDAELTAEEDAQALADAKEAAKSALDGYKDADVYREAEQAELAVAIQAGKDAIDAAETVAEVEAALETAQADMDAIKTAAQLTAEEDSTDAKDPVVPEADDSEADVDKEQTQEVEEKESEETPIVKTGDETPLMAVMSTLLISASLLAGLLFRKRRNA